MNSTQMKTAYTFFFLFLLVFVHKIQGQDTLLFDLDEIVWASPTEALPVRVQHFDEVIAFQFTIEWDTSALSLDSVGHFTLDGLTDSAFNLEDKENGNITIAWDDVTITGISLDDGASIFSLFFTPREAALDTNLVQFTSDPTPPVAVRFSNGDVEEYTPNLLDGHVEVLAPLAILTFEHTALLACPQDTNGVIEIEMTGGVQPYAFYWDGHPGTSTLNNLGAGTYELLIIDAADDSLTMTFTIAMPANLEVDTADITPTCLDESTGAIDIELTGGTEPYSFNWSNGTTTEDIGMLMAGAYNLEVEDANHCISNFEFEILPVEISTDVELSNPSCFEATDGSIQLTTAENYEFEWDIGSIANTISNLAAGSYAVSISNSEGCLQVFEFELQEPDPVTVFAESIQPVSCFGGNDGSLSLGANGGDGNYTFFYAESTTPIEPPVFNELSAGSYFFFAVDGQNCESSVTELVITEASEIEVIGTASDLLCYEEPTGSIILDVNGGVGDYQFQWDNGTSSSTLEGLQAGTYNVTVSDSNSCEVTASFELAEPEAISIMASLIAPSCDGSEPGSIVLTTEGGTGTYIFNWSNGMSGPEINGLNPGTYQVHIEDDNGCQIDETYIVEEPQSIDPTVLINYGCGEGTISLNAITLQGTPPYSYLWSTGDTTKQIFGLSAGTYSVTVFDSAECSGTETIEAEAIAPLNINSVRDHISCFGAADGQIDLTVTGSLPPYSFEWSNGSTTEDITGLSVGNYDVNISSAAGCNFFLSFQINEPPPLNNTLLTEQLGNGFWSARAIPSGGVPPYLINWSSGDVGTMVDNLAMGVYEVQIVDSNGCELVETFGLGVSSVVEAGEQISWQLHPNPTYGLVHINIENQAAIMGELKVFNSIGRQVETRSMEGVNWQDIIDLEYLPPGIYWIQIDSNLGQASKKLFKN